MEIPRAHALIACLLAAVGTARIVSTYRVFNHTIDEPDNLAAGMEYLSTGKYRYEDTHPPLARVFAAIGPYLAGERFHPGPDAYSEGYRILGHGAHYDRILALGRVGNLVFFWVASLVVFLWGLRAGGPAAAVLATLLFTTLPPVLAHAAVITTDAALCAMTAAAGLAFLYWLDRPDRRRSVWLGALAALACLSKFSALVFLPAAALAIAWCFGPRRLWRLWAEYKRPAGLALGTACLVIWACYGFSFARVEFLHARLPAPRFFSGIHAVWAHNQAGHPSYLMGRRSPDGFWYYFPAVLAIKTPLGLLLLVAAAPWLLRYSKRRREASFALAFATGILAVAMTGRIDIGVRYVLPVYVGLCVAGATAAMEARALLPLLLVAVVIPWHVASGALQHPDYLAYTNEIAQSRPERFVADSDLDWGQDMKRLGVWLERAGATHLTFSPFNRTYELAGHPLPPMTPGDSDRPSPGWNAVSVTIWKVFGFPRWADRIAPQHRIGRSILLWYFPENPR